jgi:hypothetical protein
MVALAAAIKADLGCPLIPCKFQTCTASSPTLTNQQKIWAAIGNEWASDANVLPGPDLSTMVATKSDGLHLFNQADMFEAASRWYQALTGTTVVPPPTPTASPAPPARTFVVPFSGAMSKIQTKTVEEVKNYTFDWSTVAPGDPVATLSFTASPADLGVPETGINSSTLTTILTSGGTLERLYFLRAEVVTASDLELSATLRLLIVANNFV